MILTALVDEHASRHRARTAPRFRLVKRHQDERRPCCRWRIAARCPAGEVRGVRPAPATSALRDELVAAHMGLAAYLARRFANRGQPLDDLIQVASLGLFKAVDRFDPGRESSSRPTPPTPSSAS